MTKEFPPFHLFGKSSLFKVIQFSHRTNNVRRTFNWLSTSAELISEKVIFYGNLKFSDGWMKTFKTYGCWELLNHFYFEILKLNLQLKLSGKQSLTWISAFLCFWIEYSRSNSVGIPVNIVASTKHRSKKFSDKTYSWLTFCLFFRQCLLL